MPTPESLSPATPKKAGDGDPRPTDCHAPREPGIAPPHRGRHGETTEAVCEAESERRAKRKALLLMGASAVLMLALLAGAWVLFGHMRFGRAG
jgi:hypothetical protein